MRVLIFFFGLSWSISVFACDLSDSKNESKNTNCYIENGIALKIQHPKVGSGEVSWVQAKISNASSLVQVHAIFEGIMTELFPISQDSYGALVPVPFGVRTGTYAINIKVTDGKSERSMKAPLQVVDNQEEDNVEVLNARSDEVRPKDPAVVERIIREEANAEKIYASNSKYRYWKGPFLLPLEGKVTSPFGRYRIYTSHLRRRVHWGVDLKAPIGTRVYASASGKVVLAKNQYFGGNTVMIDHGFGLVSTYMHLKTLKVKLGQTVDQGALLGLSGITGKTTGPHLHWQVVLNRVKLDPIALASLRDIP